MNEKRLQELEARSERDPGMSSMRELIAEVRRLRAAIERHREICGDDEGATRGDRQLWRVLGDDHG